MHQGEAVGSRVAVGAMDVLRARQSDQAVKLFGRSPLHADDYIIDPCAARWFHRLDRAALFAGLL